MEASKETYYNSVKEMDLNTEVSRSLSEVLDVVTLEEIKDSIKGDMIRCANNIVLGYSVINQLKNNTEELIKRQNSEENGAEYEEIINNFVDNIKHTFDAIEEDVNQIAIYREAYDSIQQNTNIDPEIK
jgi:hypothetical protein